MKKSTDLERIVSASFFVGLVLFAAAQVLPVSGKGVNNIAYGLILLPTLILLLSSPRSAYQQLRQALPLWGFLISVLLISLINQEPEHTKAAVYVLIFCAGLLLVLQRQPRALFFSYTGLAALSIILLGWIAQQWLTVFLSSGETPRLALWGRAENPIYAGLLVISALVFLWLNFVEKNSNNRQSARYLTLSGAVLLLGLAAIVFFQARSALVGLVVCLAAFLQQQGRLKHLLIVLMLILLALIVSGTAEAIFARGLSYRPEIWLDAINQLQRDCSLLLGCGHTEELFLGQYKGMHSGYVGNLYRHGLLASGTFLIFALWYVWHGLQTRSSWFLVSLVGWGGMLTAMDGFVGSPHAWWVFFWMPTMAAIHDFARPGFSQTPAHA